jgi:hypothetical protein
MGRTLTQGLTLHPMDEDLSMGTPALGYSHALPPGGTCGAANCASRMGFVVSHPFAKYAKDGAPKIHG